MGSTPVFPTSTITILTNDGWWEKWEREWGEGGWMLVATWKNHLTSTD